MSKLLLFLLVSTIAFANNFQCDKIINNGILNICYSYTVKGPLYVDYNVSANNVDRYNIKKRPRFYKDKHINKKYSVSPNDYINVTDSKTMRLSFDRGHMAPDADFDYSKQSLLKVYTMANISPQRSIVNRITWKKIEEKERSIARKYGKITVRTGSLYEDKDLFLVKKSFQKIIENRERKYHKKYSEKYLKKQYKKYLKYKKSLYKKHILIPTKLYKIIRYDNKKSCYLVDNIGNDIVSNNCSYVLNYIKKLTNR